MANYTLKFYMKILASLKTQKQDLPKRYHRERPWYGKRCVNCRAIPSQTYVWLYVHQKRTWYEGRKRICLKVFKFDENYTPDPEDWQIPQTNESTLRHTRSALWGPGKAAWTTAEGRVHRNRHGDGGHVSPGTTPADIMAQSPALWWKKKISPHV